MKLRAAEEADLEALSAVHRRAFTPGWGPEEIADLASGPGAFGLIVEAETPLGMILCRALAGEAEVLTLAVDPAARRQGVARALVAAAAITARAAGAAAMFLEVAVDNDPAIALYEAHGFVRAGRRPSYYDRGGGIYVDAAVMRLDLGGTSL
ncbi:GNAT family N-acetyltransferase [Phenylobacterium sp. 20VBR1]|uniref:GNAT family N-acetyltransferase n=1 Tax=Phenylobacterium glaciei TaxID=2803784 RepID=A0A941HUD0_9CAUL|nr:GNAT family N-acetyltransferase [Phenylobacterium glaciei]MBR7617986.1 GNAT family N-acetyltransferase [Phenylobacterium glaciei]